MTSDAELIGRSLAGDGEAFMEVISRHEGAVGAYLARRAGRAAAEDLLGDVWMAAFESRRTYDFWLSRTGSAQRAAWDKEIAKEWPTLKAKGMKTPPKLPAGQALQNIINNRVWSNSVEALSAGGGNPQVRAGVLRLLSTIPQVAVAKSTTGGQATLTLKAGSALFGGSGGEVLTISAKTGMPIKDTEPAQGNVPSSVAAYKVTRVTLAAIASGKF
jgi:hypothetical protein